MRALRPSVSTLDNLPKHLLLALIAFAVFVRALVPTGFMPDHAGRGALMVSFCTADGKNIAIPLALSSEDYTDPADATPSAECPFNALASHAILPDVVHAVVRAAAVSYPVVHYVYVAAPALPAVGPPLGSRAPPEHLV